MNQLACLQHHSSLSLLTCQQYLRILSRLKRMYQKSYRDITVDEITQFIGTLPGSMKPQAFAAVKLLYGKILLAKMPEGFQKQWPRIQACSAKQRQRLPELGRISHEELMARTEAYQVDTRALIWSLFFGMKMSEALSLMSSDVREDMCLLPGRQWEIPSEIQDEIKALRDVASVNQTSLFSLTRHGYNYRLRKRGLSPRQLRTSGIAYAFERGNNADETWRQFGIFDDQQKIKYWKIYGNI